MAPNTTMGKKTINIWGIEVVIKHKAAEGFIPDNPHPMPNKIDPR